ncbi:MAG: hypothetical protein IKP86_01280 [Anaerolineaceae bacterium]|nr:hypothetical protein [Anaerolineaceae bacterium]
MSEESINVQTPEGKEEIPVLYPQVRIKAGLLGTFFGFLLVVLGAKPEFFGMDRSPVIGFAQTAAFLVGLGIIGYCGYFTLMCFWPKGYTTITADFGIRLLATGWLIAVFSGMADVLGFGSHPVTGLVFFGRLQSMGVEIGEMIMGIGLVMMIMPPHSGLRVKPEENINRIDMTQQ